METKKYNLLKIAAKRLKKNRQLSVVKNDNKKRYNYK